MSQEAQVGIHGCRKTERAAYIILQIHHKSLVIPHYPCNPPSFSPFIKGGLRGINRWITLAFLFSFLVIFTTVTNVKAGIYTYEDENGTVHFTNVPTDPQFRMIIPPEEEKTEVISKKVQGDFHRLIVEKSYKYGLDPALVKAVIAVESDFNPKAVSEKGARGLMQLMPMTARELGVYNLFDPVDNVDGGTRYLKYLLDYFNWDIDLALAAYNAGISRVLTHSGIPPIPETMRYVSKVRSVYRKYILQ
ncbi:MAG: lytic transglycosylase domain-containing protein [Nitrospirae bacterium]|nr:lytic transglycosylase domain-containing protein [Nitrospirota bacterium]